MMGSVTYRTVEFHRFGGSANLLAPENKYIRTAGWDAVATEVSPTLDHKTFLRNLNMLRYGIARAADAARAQATLAAEAGRFLDGVQPVDGQLLQVDLVTNAGELWAFPFEVSFATLERWLKDPDGGVVITRRIRGDFSSEATPWPVTPRVLFMHAPVAKDLAQALIDEHIAELIAALAPWAKGKDPIASELLAVHGVTSLDEVTRHREAFKPTYVHILAHGAPAPTDPFLPEDVTWGLRLGDIGRPGVPPAEVAEALQPQDGLPVVVTVAACDSGNQASPFFAARSVAQELHRRGVPVVIASQLPLTKPGSRTLTRVFYRRLLQGEDVRVALHAARVALKSDQDAGHDWLSVVGYVRLPPEGYAAYLDEVGLRVELQLLDAAQRHADTLSAEAAAPLSTFADIEQRVRDRLQSLNRRKSRLAHRKDLLNECCGLEASSYKRLAELLFVRGSCHSSNRDADWKASNEALGHSFRAYRTAYEADLHSHWLGVQRLALDAALSGAVSRPGDYAIVERAAEIARQFAIQKGKDVGQGEEEYWALGSLTELALLAPKAGRQKDLGKAKTYAALLVQRAGEASQLFPIQSTRRQITRYVSWWTNEHGFFPANEDLSGDAREILTVFPGP
jgi:CHAT domain